MTFAVERTAFGAEGETTGVAGTTVLVVDDQDENLAAMETTLETSGVAVLLARSGREALELLLVHDVAVALLDVHMPDMDGFELADLMRGVERTKSIPIIFVTADDRKHFRGYEAGAVDYLVKPVEPAMIRAKVGVFLELHRQRRELAELLRMNETFVGVLGHDLRNPLTAMMGSAHLLARELTDPRQRQLVDRLAESGARMNRMIEQLLDLTRARLAGGLVRVRRPVDVAAILERVVGELRVAHPERSIALDVRAPGAHLGDEDRLMQLFSNLVANALAHSPPGSDVSVSLEVDGPVPRDAGEGLVVRVSNEGSIPDEIRRRLFAPFHEHRSPPPSGSHGLGLGLFISAHIAAGHGGEINVSSADGRTTFAVRLPYAGARAGADPRA